MGGCINQVLIKFWAFGLDQYFFNKSQRVLETSEGLRLAWKNKSKSTFPGCVAPRLVQWLSEQVKYSKRAWN